MGKVSGLYRDKTHVPGISHAGYITVYKNFRSGGTVFAVTLSHLSVLVNGNPVFS